MRAHLFFPHGGQGQHGRFLTPWLHLAGLIRFHRLPEHRHQQLRILKATANGSGCTRKEIEEQLDKQFKAPNDALLRAVEDAGKVGDVIKNAVKGARDIFK